MLSPYVREATKTPSSFWNSCLGGKLLSVEIAGTDSDCPCCCSRPGRSFVEEKIHLWKEATLEMTINQWGNRISQKETHYTCFNWRKWNCDGFCLLLNASIHVLRIDFLKGTWLMAHGRLISEHCWHFPSVHCAQKYRKVGLDNEKFKW